MRRYFLIQLLFLVGIGDWAKANYNLKELNLSHNFDYVLFENARTGFSLHEEDIKDRPLVGFQFDSISTPLPLFDATKTNRRDIVERMSTLAAMVSYPVGDSTQVGIDVGVSSADLKDKGKVTALGDIRLLYKKQIADPFRNVMGLAFVANAFLPTGDRDKYTSNDSFGFEASLALEKRWRLLGAGAQLGYRKYIDADADKEWSDHIPTAAGIHISMGKGVAFNIEARGGYDTKSKEFNGVGEAFFGASFNAGYGGRFYCGASTSKIESDNSRSVRVIAGYKLIPGLEAPTRAVMTNTVVERVEKIIDHCGPETVTQTFSARRLTSAERAKLGPLPYISTDKNRIRTIQIGEMTGLQDGLPVVRDAQVLFAVDTAGMPKRSSVIKIESALLKLEVRKLSADNSKDTEILCLLNEKVCSGEYFENDAWRENVNPAFTGGKETPNDYFIKQYLSTPVTKLNGKPIYAGALVMPLDKLIENSLVREPIDIFYQANSELPRTLYFLVADDTYLSNNVKLDLVITVDNCKTKTTTKVTEGKAK